MNQYVIIYPESHQHLGLFKDLERQSNVTLVVAKQIVVRNRILKILKKVHTTPIINKKIRLPKKDIWYEDVELNCDNDENNYYIIVFDSALKALNASKTNKVFKKTNAYGMLMLINSMDADSAGMIDVKAVINDFEWNNVYSFDPVDVKKYGFKQIQYSYYSRVSIDELDIQEDEHKKKQVFFVGGLKGDREQLILDIFEKFDNNGISTDFQILLTGTRRLGEKRHSDKINYYTGGWIPYHNVLQRTCDSDCILEIVQNGQHGPSLRYFEAVCYNKKLITNNKDIVGLPYYNEKYMKVIETADDIDINWVIDKSEEVDYGYRGDFSPKGLLVFVTHD